MLSQPLRGCLGLAFDWLDDIIEDNLYHMLKRDDQTQAPVSPVSKVRGKKHGWVARLKLLGLVVAILAGLATVCGTFYTIFLSRANKADIQALQLVNNSLQQQIATGQTQREAQERQNDNWQRQVEEQKLEISRLRQQQAGFQQALSNAQTVGALKDRILSERKAIRDLWASVVDKDFYCPPNVPVEELILQSKLARATWAEVAHSNAEWWKHVFDSQPKPDPADNQRKAVLAEKEEHFNELLAAAKALGLVEEMPKGLKALYPKNLEMRPIRTVYRFADDHTWWTVFQDFGALPDVPKTRPVAWPAT